MENYLNKYNVQVNESMELVSNEAVKQAVNARLGVSIMPIIGIRNELRVGDLQIIPVRGLPIITTWNLVHRSGKKLSPANQALLDYIELNKEVIAKDHFSWISK